MLLFYNSEHYFINFLGWLEAKIAQNMYFIVAILKIHNVAHTDIWIFHAQMIQKMYRFANLQKY